MTEGNIHSIETLGLVDGPGIRVVVFMQGCALRCRYCHNPDTWDVNAAAHKMTPKQLVQKLTRYKTYFASAGGGVTFSGGEPLLQPEFLLETLMLCREAGIHTCLDTAGVGRGRYDGILQYTDLVLYDVKHEDPAAYKALTGHDMGETLRFLDAVRRNGTPLWVRHVVVPDLTDGIEHLEKLAAYCKTLPNVQKTELLSYHRLGVEKYHRLGLCYSLEDTPPLSSEKLAECQRIFDLSLK